MIFFRFSNFYYLCSLKIQKRFLKVDLLVEHIAEVAQLVEHNLAPEDKCSDNLGKDERVF